MSVRLSKQTRLQKLQAAKDRMKVKKKKVDPNAKYRRTGGYGYGLSSAAAVNKKREEKKKREARIKADLKKRQAKQAAAEKKAAKAKAKQKRIEREEGPGQATKPKRKSSYTSPFAGMPQDSVFVRTAGRLGTSPEDRKKRKDAAKKRQDKQTWKDALEAGTWVLGGPALGFGIKVAVKGGQKLFKYGKEIYKSAEAARKAAKAKEGIKQLGGPKTPKQIAAPLKRITDQRTSAAKTAPPKEQFTKVISGEGRRSKVPDLKPPVVKTPTPKVTAKPTPKVTAKPTPKVTAKTTPKVTAKPTPKVTVKPTPKVTAKPTPKVTAKPIPKVTAKPIPKVTAKPQSRRYQPPISRRPSPFKTTTAKTTAKGTPKVTPKTGGPRKNPFGGKYGGTWPKQGKWTPAVGRAKAVRALKNAGKTVTAKNIAKIGGGALAGYGLSELLRDRKPGEKPTVPTGTKTRADLHKPYQTPKTPTISAADQRKRDEMRKGRGDQTLPIAQRKAKTYGGKLTDSAGSAKMGGRPEERRSRHVAEDKVAFLKSRGGTDKNINKGFEFNLIGKNKTAAEAKKAGDEAYKREQIDRKRPSQSDFYKYGEGRRSKLKQVAKKGGTVRAKKGRAIVKKTYNTGGVVKFSSGGSVIDTYNYDN